MNEMLLNEHQIQEELERPFKKEQIHWRVGNTNAKKLNVPAYQATEGSLLAYLDARDVMNRLDKVVGFNRWQCRYPFVGCCEIGIKFGDEWVWKSNAGAETQVEAEKGQASDAFKRAAVLWGIGRYLYSLPFTWVTLADVKGNGGQIDPKKVPELPEWALPKEKRINKETMQVIISQILSFLDKDDDLGIKETVGELTPDEQYFIWGMFSTKQKSAIKSLLHKEAA